MELNDYLDLPYTVTLRRDDEGDWIARVQELSGCIAHGSTEVEALEQLREAKRDWISAALEDHIDVPLPEAEDELPSGKWVQRVPRSLHKQLARLAKTERTSLNSLVTSILSDYVGGTRRQATVVNLASGLTWFTPIRTAGANFVTWGNAQVTLGGFIEGGAANIASEHDTLGKVANG